MSDDCKQIYLDAYEKFNAGDFEGSFELGKECLAATAPDTYYRFGALGLLCWCSNFMLNNSNVEIYGNKLIAFDTGGDKPWFDGLARFNLGMKCRRNSRLSEARRYFARASENYAAYKASPEQPPEWTMVNRFFTVLTGAAATDDPAPLRTLAEDLDNFTSRDEEIEHLRRAVQLNIRYIEGETVLDEAQKVADEGVSRTFLALILLCVKHIDL